MKKRYLLFLAIAVLLLASFLALLFLSTDTPPPPASIAPTTATEDESEKDISANGTSEQANTVTSESAPTSESTAPSECASETQNAPSEKGTEGIGTPGESSSTPSESATQEQTREEAIILPQAITYTVSVLDSRSRPLSGVRVRIMKSGLLVSERTTQNGAASFSLPPDGYEIDFDLTDTPYFYNSLDPIPLFAQSPSACVTLYDRPASAEEINAYSPKAGAFQEYEAKSIAFGGSYADVPALDRAYFLFTPSEQGEYRFCLDSEYALILGYFGSPDFVQADSLTPPNDENSFTLTVRENQIGCSYVIGITSYEDADFFGILHVEKVGDATPLPADTPYLFSTAPVSKDFAWRFARRIMENE